MIHFKKNKGKPPALRKVCCNCERVRTFRYDPAIGHSRCVECGFHGPPTYLKPLKEIKVEE